MMRTAARPFSAGRVAQTLQLWWLMLAVLVVFGVLTASSFEAAAAYLLICVAALVPAWIWLRDGARGVPVLPVVALMSLQFYAFPILSENYETLRYRDDEVLLAALTVALYSFTATLAWWRARRVSPAVSTTARSAPRPSANSSSASSA